ncbi:sigma factor [Oceanobacillus timonensis]|uniref:sigma factor n=1 Tax=Oceanobacillus timonensis TaxID=1926285 RepID=UPI0009BAD678|nr:sigma factor [Oceanobacillus timonensis]
MEKKHWDLEDFLHQNQRRVYYQMSRLQIENEKEDYFQEGLVAMWRAYENYNPDKGPLATYMNFQIRNRLVDVFRKSIAEKKYFQHLSYQQKIETQSGNYMNRMKTPFADEGKNQLEENVDFINENDFKSTQKH